MSPIETAFPNGWQTPVDHIPELTRAARRPREQPMYGHRGIELVKDHNS
jgi:hypothetical protein